MLWGTTFSRKIVFFLNMSPTGFPATCRERRRRKFLNMSQEMSQRPGHVPFVSTTSSADNNDEQRRRQCLLILFVSTTSSADNDSDDRDNDGSRRHAKEITSFQLRIALTTTMNNDEGNNFYFGLFQLRLAPSPTSTMATMTVLDDTTKTMTSFQLRIAPGTTVRRRRRRTVRF